MPKQYLCLQTLKRSDGKRAFTVGKTYTVQDVDYLAGKEEEIEFVDDQNERHIVSSNWLVYFQALPIK